MTMNLDPQEAIMPTENTLVSPQLEYRKFDYKSASYDYLNVLPLMANSTAIPLTAAGGTEILFQIPTNNRAINLSRSYLEVTIAVTVNAAALVPGFISDCVNL